MEETSLEEIPIDQPKKIFRPPIFFLQNSLYPKTHTPTNTLKHTQTHTIKLPLIRRGNYIFLSIPLKLLRIFNIPKRLRVHSVYDATRHNL